MIDKGNSVLIEGYLKGTLSVEERKEFLKRASTDKAFIKEFIREAELNDSLNELLGED